MTFYRLVGGVVLAFVIGLIIRPSLDSHFSFYRPVTENQVTDSQLDEIARRAFASGTFLVNWSRASEEGLIPAKEEGLKVLRSRLAKSDLPYETQQTVIGEMNNTYSRVFKKLGELVKNDRAMQDNLSSIYGSALKRHLSQEDRLLLIESLTNPKMAHLISSLSLSDGDAAMQYGTIKEGLIQANMGPILEQELADFFDRLRTIGVDPSILGMKDPRTAK